MKPHRVYTLFRNLGIAFWVTVTAVIVCTAALPLYFVDALALLAVAIGLVRPYRSDKPFSAGRKIFAGVMKFWLLFCDEMLIRRYYLVISR